MQNPEMSVVSVSVWRVGAIPADITLHWVNLALENKRNCDLFEHENELKFDLKKIVNY